MCNVRLYCAAEYLFSKTIAELPLDALAAAVSLYECMYVCTVFKNDWSLLVCSLADFWVSVAQPG